MKYKTELIILIGVVIIGGLLLVVATVLSNKTKKSRVKVNKQQYKKESKLYESIYWLLSKFLLTKGYVNRIKKQLEQIDLSNQWSIHKKVVKIVSISFGISFLMAAFLIWFKMSLVVIGLAIYAAYSIHNQLFHYMIMNIDDQLLNQFGQLLGNVRYHYHTHGMIDEAIYDSIEECDYEISLHAIQFYEILTAHDVKERLEQYYDTVTNKYFKTFIALCHTVQVYGDQKIDGNMLFLSNLNYLKEEIDMELLRRAKLKYLFRSLVFIGICPLLFIFPIEKWAVTNMSELNSYYCGAYGFITRIIICVIVVLGFQLLTKLQEGQNFGGSLNHTIESRLLKVKWIKRSVYYFQYKHYSYFLKLEKLLKSLGSKVTIEVFILKRILYMIGAVIISFVIVINSHIILRQSILYPYQYVNPNDDSIDYGMEKVICDYDYDLIMNYRNEKVTYMMIEEAVKEDGNLTDSGAIAIASKRIFEKINQYQKLYFKWWELLICLLMGYIAYMIPYWLLMFRKRILQMNMEDEVVEFNTIILMLMYVKRITVEDILIHMEIFAYVFKESIQKCINDFEYGDYEALEQLKNDEPYLPFVRIVQRLQIATNRITIKSAFDELKTDRNYYKDKRKHSNEILIEKKGLWGKIIAFTPFTTTVVLYLLVPFIHYSVTQFIQYSEQLNYYM